MGFHVIHKPQLHTVAQINLLFKPCILKSCHRYTFGGGINEWMSEWILDNVAEIPNTDNGVGITF